MKKRILSMLLALVMVVGLVPGFAVTASAATEVYASGNLGQGNRTAWTIYDNGLLVIDGKGNSISAKWDSTTASPWKDYADIITRASFVNCENWVRIPENTFRGLSNLNEVILPENIEEICQYAFSGAALETIILPERLKKIGSNAFSLCESLNYININDGVTSIGSSAFSNCSSLKAISIPDSVTSIGQTLFQNCTNLEYVRLSENATKVGGSMFSGCTMLKNISLPASVTVIGSKAFSNASYLTGVYYHGINEPTTYNPGLNNATFSLAPDTMVIYSSNDYLGTTIGLKANWENDVHNVTKIDGYFVNVAHTIGGAVKVDKSIVPVGDTVTVDIMAYKNYALDTFAVTGADGNEITVTGDSNTRTFSMPEGDVTITATFKSTIVPHVHSWTFEVEETSIRAIKATCANTDGMCHNPYQSVIMTPPSTKYFAWNLERTVTVSGTIEDVEIPEVVYTLKSTGEVVRPFAPGVYVASLTIENTTLTYEYEITKSNQLNYTFFTYTAPENLTYDGTAKIATVVPNATVDAYIGDVEVLYNRSATLPVTVGTYTVTFNVEESDYFTAKTNLSLGGRGGKTFSIVAKDIKDLTYTDLATSYPVGATPDVTIEYNGMTLVKDTDYTIEYANNTESGTATMTITGKGNYTGTKTLEFNISAHTHSWTYAASGDTITATCGNNNCSATTDPTLTLSVAMTNNAPVATVTHNETWTTANGLPAVPGIIYVDGSNLESATVPTTAGTYTAKITVSDEVASVVFEILDYAGIDAAIKSVPAVMSNYTDETVNAVNVAKAAAETAKSSATTQAELNSAATALTNAINELAYKPADYTAVDAALDAVPGDLSVYTAETKAAVEAAVAAVVRGKNITEQATVTGYATAIENAVAGLITELCSAEITVTVPAKGATPTTSAVNGTGYTVGTLSWNGSPEVFLGSTEYTVTFTLTAADKYVFASNAAITVPGAKDGGVSAEVAQDGKTVSVSATFPATLTKGVTSVVIKTMPTDTAYTYGDAFDPTGLVLTVSYDDSSVEDVTYNDETKAAFSFGSEMNVSTTAVTVTYGGKSANIAVTVAPKALTITVADKSVYVGSQKPDLSAAASGTDYTISGLVGGDTVTVTLSYATEPDMTKAGEYAITATGTDVSGNYTFDVVDGKLTVSYRPSSGGSSNTTSKTEKNEDGSTTTTTTNKTTGTVTETTKYPDGSTTTVETKKDGSATETSKTSDGTIGTVATDKDGNVTEVSAKVPAAAVKAATESGEAVKLPVKVEAADDADKAVEIEVDVPTGGAKVDIPVEDVTSGTVVVVVNKDGTEEIVKKSTVTEDGVVVALDEDATLKIVDNSKHFVDVHPIDHWAETAVDFVVARTIYSGTSATTFHPDNPMTRGMLAVVLHNLEDNPDHAFDGFFHDVVEGSWYEDAIHWAADSGIVSGYGNGLYGPNDNITREQLAVMLWRYAGSPDSDHSLAHFKDAHLIASYAETALAWANENGIINGKGDGILDPKGNATRAQVAQMLMNYLQK